MKHIAGHERLWYMLETRFRCSFVQHPCVNNIRTKHARTSEVGGSDDDNDDNDDMWTCVCMCVFVYLSVFSWCGSVFGLVFVVGCCHDLLPQGLLSSSLSLNCLVSCHCSCPPLSRCVPVRFCPFIHVVPPWFVLLVLLVCLLVLPHLFVCRCACVARITKCLLHCVPELFCVRPCVRAGS